MSEHRAKSSSLEGCYGGRMDIRVNEFFVERSADYWSDSNPPASCCAMDKSFASSMSMDLLSGMM